MIFTYMMTMEFLTNPPYGERLGDQKIAHNMYDRLGHKFKTLDTWSKYIITSDKDFEKVFRKIRKRPKFRKRIR